MPETVAATFRRPFHEQVAAFRLRLQELRPTYSWDQYDGQSHDRAFMVAGATKADLLASIAAAVDRAIAEGTGIEAFRRDFRKIVETQGWPGKAGQGSEKGFAWRTRVIYRTNMRTTYMAGRRAQLVDGNYRFWVYRHSGAVHPRLDHLSWDGLALPPDHPFWATHYPPNGWGCGCVVEGARTEASIRRMGGDPGKTLPEGWDRPDPRTGVPSGLDRGWDHAPGASVTDEIRTMAEKAIHWPYQIAKAHMADLPEDLRDRFARGYRALPSLAEDVRRSAERALGERGGEPITSPANPEPYRTLGLLTAEQAGDFGPLVGQDVAGFDFALSPQAVGHIRNSHGDEAVERPRGQRAVTPADYARLAMLLNTPAQMSFEKGNLVFVWDLGEETVRAAFQVLPRRRMLALVTMWVTVRAPRQ